MHFYLYLGYFSSSLVDTKAALRKFSSPKVLRYEEIRLATFHNWDVPFIKKEDLARAGFFYLARSDHVQCAFCQGVVGYWENGDHPETEHRKHFPQCPLLLGNPTGNIPIVKDVNADQDIANKFLYEYLDFRLNFTKPIPISSRLQTGKHTIECLS